MEKDRIPERELPPGPDAISPTHHQGVPKLPSQVPTQPDKNNLSLCTQGQIADSDTAQVWSTEPKIKLRTQEELP